MDEQTTVRRLQDLTYPRLNLNDHTLDSSLPPPSCPPDIKRPRLPPTCSVGILDTLPPELLQVILYGLDLRTLTSFLRVNRRAMELVHSSPQYKAISTHASNVLRGVLGIETGRWITCATLYEKLCTPECEQCGDFASYLYILTCKRVCFLCLSSDRLYLPLSLRRASCKFGLDNRILGTLPHMRVIPGIYSPNEKRVRAPSVLVDYLSALRAGISLHGSSSAMRKYVAEMEARKLQAFNTRVEAAQQSESKSKSIARRLLRPRTSDPFDGESGNPFRFVAIVEVPCLNRQTQQVEWGFHCVGCKNSSRPPLHWRRKFTAASFDAHLNECGDIRQGEHRLS